jgi:RNA polymerase sigma-70 factor (ECF subfamily)
MIFFMNVIGAPAPTRTYKIDDDLITRIGADDPDAFNTLYENINQPLHAYILSLTQDAQNAEDVLQETYLKIRSAAHLYKAMGKPMAWIFTIARNLSMMQHRSAKRTVEEEIDQLEHDPRFSTQFDREDHVFLKEILSQLNEKERSIILLHTVSGYKHREIARDLNMPLSTVLSNYSRGMNKLRMMVEYQKASSK